MEIQLSQKQNELIQESFNQQAALQREAQAAFDVIQKRLNDIVAVILDTKGMPMVEGIVVKDGKLVIPEQADGTIPFENVE